ncbi:LpqB family beta-propeller domain-containing protein [Amycolatopsis minnesotensis]|uniref:LpqB family beta-propeller domain-containing protein n=1 Tax=Amycolatopsis minnesotensis TaxID=337894 RepID=A0ABN2R697_9PSEU
MTKPFRLVCLALMSCVVLVAGCANVPEESQPEVVTPRGAQVSSPDVKEPDRNLDALSVVRAFVHASALPTENNAGARVYLDEQVRQKWSPVQGFTVIDDTFGTVYDTSQPQDQNERSVVLRGFTVGELGADAAFISGKRSYEWSYKVRRQADGQWRLLDPPPNIVLAESDFIANYFRVPVYFIAPESNVLVPDLRYVAAKPQSGLPGRVVNLLLDGPSNGLVGAVRTAIPDQTTLETNVQAGKDGALVVPLSGVGDQGQDIRKLMAAQIVQSLQSVTTSRVQLLGDGRSLVTGHDAWLPSELPSNGGLTAPAFELQGLMVVNGRVRSLADGQPVSGSAGDGSVGVLSAAQSLDGKRLALVENDHGKQQLRIGEFGGEMPRVSLYGSSLTRPTWRPTLTAGGVASELWTVVDNRQVLRVSRSADGRWLPQVVNADEIAATGQITALRLSRDGTRAALIVNGQLVIASVARAQDSVTLRMPKTIRGGELSGVVDVDWAGADIVIVATNSASQPVVKVPIDGLRADPFNSSNLTPPVHAVAAAPGRSVMVADAGGLWTALDIGEVWRPHQPAPLNGVETPFYPG